MKELLLLIAGEWRGVITGTFLVLIPIVLYFSVWRTFNLPNAPTPDKLQKAVGTYFMTAHFWGPVYVLAVGLSTTHNILRFCPESLTLASAAFFVSLLHFLCFLYILFRATCFEAQSFKIMRYFLLFYPFVVLAYEMAFHIPGTYIIHSKVNVKIPTSDFFQMFPLIPAIFSWSYFIYFHLSSTAKQLWNLDTEIKK